MDRDAAAWDPAPARGQLAEDGYCRVPRVLDPGFLRSVQELAAAALDTVGAEHRAQWRSQGSLIALADHPPFAALIAYPGLQEMFSRMGLDDTRFTSGYVISKPPGGPALFWHQDWWGWDDPSSYTPLPQQLFLMYYLVDTTPHNGCLRLLRGSHRKRHRMHDEVPNAHTDALRRVADPDHPAYQSIPEEVDVPVAAGDVVIGDARLLHSAHANKSAQRRTVITLWYFPYFDLLSDGLRATIARPREWVGWDDEDRARVADLLPIYEGTAAPVPWNRMPGEALTP